jgi:hypothetical protein
MSQFIDPKTGEISVRDPLDTSKLDNDLLEFAKEASWVTDKQRGLFASLYERQHGAPPEDDLMEKFAQLGKRQAAAYIDVLLGRQTIKLAEKGAEKVAA